MINNYHVSIIMNLVMLHNQNRKKKWTAEQLREIEGNMIKISNHYNKVINAIYNNKFSNWLKLLPETLFGGHYPEFLYSDQLEMYVSKLPETPQKGDVVDIQMTDNSQYAQDFSQIGFFKKRQLLKLINKTCSGEGVYFRYRKILEYR